MKRETFLEKLPRSVYVWTSLFTLFGSFALFLAAPLTLLHAVGLDPERVLASRIVSAGMRGFLVFCTWVGVLRVRGLPPRGRGPFVVVANHESNLDICLVQAHAPWPVKLVAKRSLREVPVVGVAVAAGGSLFTVAGPGDEPGDRAAPEGGASGAGASAGAGPSGAGASPGAGLSSVVDEGLRALRAGCSVGIFPEGTRSRGQGIRRFRRGAFELAAASGAPILPLVIVGSGEFMPAGGVLPLGPYRITLEALPPRRLEGDPLAFARALRAEVAAAHARILAEPYHRPTRIERETVPTGPAATES